MVRTIVALDEQDKAWLDERARAEGVPMTELIRRAVRMLRAAPDEATAEELLERTRGIWRSGDGLEYHKRVRDEWG